jgi:hypothetical protein
MAYEHGTISRYTAKGCRCDACKTANRSYQRAYQAKRKAARPPTPDQLRTCENCNQFYIAKLNSKQRFCNNNCAKQTSRILTCTKCGDGYKQRQTHPSVTAPVCDTCLADLAATGTVCPICEIPWWAPGGDKCCGVECRVLLDAKQELVEASR